MAVTLGTIKRNVYGVRKSATVPVTGPASYTTGGELLTLAQQQAIMGGEFGGGTVNFASFGYFDSERSPAGITCVLDRTNNKLLFFAAGAEAGSGSNQSTVPVNVRFEWGGQD